MTTHHISHRLSTSLRTLLITATILLVSVSAMAQTEDLTNKINDPGISAISPDPAHWHRGAHVATATTVNFNTSSVPDNNNVNFNSANSGAWMNASTTQANEIWQEFNVNFEAGYLYTISFEQTANTNPVIFSVAYKNSSNGYTNLEHAKVSLNLGPGNRKTYFYYVQPGNECAGKPMAVRLMNTSEINIANTGDVIVKNVQLHRTKVSAYYNYGRINGSATNIVAMKFYDGNGNVSSALGYDFPYNQRAYEDNNRDGGVFRGNGASYTRNVLGSKMFQKIENLDKRKKYFFHGSFPSDNHTPNRSQRILARKSGNAATEQQIISQFSLAVQTIQYRTTEIPAQLYYDNGEVEIGVENRNGALNGVISQLAISDEGFIVVAKPATSLPEKDSFTANWESALTLSGKTLTGYKLYVSTVSTCDSAFVSGYDGTNTIGSTATSSKVTNVPESQDHYYKIVAVYQDGYEAESEIITVPAIVVTPAYGVEVAKVGAELKWSVDFEDTVASYNVEQHIKGIWTKVTTVAAKGEPNSNYSVVVSDGEFRITAVDGSGFSQSFATTKEVFINLTKGWNLISIPFEGADLTALEADRTLWTWNGTAYEKTEKVNALQGLWVFSPAATQLTLTGTKVADATVALSTGWNLVGPAENCKVPAGLKVFSWETTYQQILDASASLIQGHGYWMFADKKTTVKLGL